MRIRDACNAECTKYDPHATHHDRQERQVGVKFLATGSPVRKPEKDVRDGGGRGKNGR